MFCCRPSRLAPLFNLTIVECPYGEGTIGEELSDIQNRHMDTVIGSYPKFDGRNYSTQIVVRGREPARISEAAREVEDMLERIRPAAGQDHESCGSSDQLIRI